MQPNKPAYTIPEYQHFSGIGRSKIYEYIASGELKSFLIGRRRLIHAEDGKQFIEKHRRAGNSA